MDLFTRSILIENGNTQPAFSFCDVRAYPVLRSDAAGFS